MNQTLDESHFVCTLMCCVCKPHILSALNPGDSAGIQPTVHTSLKNGVFPKGVLLACVGLLVPSCWLWFVHTKTFMCGSTKGTLAQAGPMLCLDTRLVQELSMGIAWKNGKLKVNLLWEQLAATLFCSPRNNHAHSMKCTNWCNNSGCEDQTQQMLKPYSRQRYHGAVLL